MNSLNIENWGQLNVLEVALDHMEEHLNDLDIESTFNVGRLESTAKLQGALAQLRSQMLNAMEK